MEDSENDKSLRSSSSSSSQSTDDERYQIFSDEDDETSTKDDDAGSQSDYEQQRMIGAILEMHIQPYMYEPEAPAAAHHAINNDQQMEEELLDYMVLENWWVNKFLFILYKNGGKG